MSLPILIQSVLIPILSAPLVYMLGRKLSYNVGWLAFAILSYSTALILAVSGAGYIESYPWIPGMGWSIGFKLDGLSIPFASNVAILSTVIAIYSMPYMKHRVGDEPEDYGSYYALYLLYVAGMLGTVLATDLIEFYIFYELMLIPSYILIARWGYGERERIAFMYFLWTHVGALILLASITLVYWITGTTSIEGVKAMLRSVGIPFTLEVGVAVAMIIGFLVKIAVLGLHIWLPHAHAEAPTPISALLSPAMIGIGWYGVIRMALGFFPRFFQVYSLPLAVWAFLTIIYGGLMALSQDDMKRLLAYSSISQMGYMFFGVANLSIVSILGSILIYLSHGLCKAVLFMVSGILIHEAGTRRISELGGLASRMPITTIVAIIGFLGLAGVPPLLGFWGELYIFLGSIYTVLKPIGGLDTTRFIVSILTVTSAVTLTAGYGLWTVKRVFFEEISKAAEESHEPPSLMLAPLLVLAVLAIILGIYPTILMNIISPVIEGLILAS
ncbi:MAG: NADH-quinone oxidoreductase subunit M [Candidatus Bathyarchaeota archaeon]|nr:NADH-quinone oxidoreductase subunit M [Candidatus Bathyarchaeota archaeon]